MGARASRVGAKLRTLLRDGGTPNGIAAGFSLGVALSLIPAPFVGMLLALMIARAFGYNLPATYLGTAVVNPLTGPFIYFSQLWLGMQLTHQSPPAFTDVRHFSTAQWWDLLQTFVGPFFTGAAISMLATLLLSYPLVWWVATRAAAAAHRREASLVDARRR